MDWNDFHNRFSTIAFKRSIDFFAFIWIMPNMKCELWILHLHRRFWCTVIFSVLYQCNGLTLKPIFPKPNRLKYRLKPKIKRLGFQFTWLWPTAHEVAISVYKHSSWGIDLFTHRSDRTMYTQSNQYRLRSLRLHSFDNGINFTYFTSVPLPIL